MALGSKGASCKSIPDSGDTRNLSNVDKLYRPNPWVSEWIWESTRKQNGRKQLRATAFAPSRSIWPTAQVVGDLLMVFPRPAPEWTQSQFWWTLFQHAGSTSCIDLATALVMSWNWLGRFHDKHGFWLFFKCRYSDNTWKLFLTLKTHEIALLSVVHYQYTIQNNPDMKCCDFDFRPIKHQKCSKHPFLNGTLIVRKQQKKNNTTLLVWNTRTQKTELKSFERNYWIESGWWSNLSQWTSLTNGGFFSSLWIRGPARRPLGLCETLRESFEPRKKKPLLHSIILDV